MDILAVILTVLGSFWTLSRLFNQPRMFTIVKEKAKDRGLLYGLWCYLRGEIFGLGLGLALILLGVYLYG